MELETTTTRGFWGPAGVLPQKRFVFLGSLNLISCNFSTIFSIFIFRQKSRTFNGQGGRQRRGWLGWGRGGALAPPVYILKKPCGKHQMLLNLLLKHFAFRESFEETSRITYTNISATIFLSLPKNLAEYIKLVPCQSFIL